MANRPNRSPLSSAYHRRLRNSRPSRYYREELEKYEQWMRKNAKASHIAYIDETYLEPKDSKHGFYTISAFVLEANRVASTREKVMRDLYDMVDHSGAQIEEYPRVFYHFTEAHKGNIPDHPWLTDQNNTKLLATVGNMPSGSITSSPTTTSPTLPTGHNLNKIWKRREVVPLPPHSSSWNKDIQESQSSLNHATLK